MTKRKAERLLESDVEIKTNVFAPGYIFCYADGVGVCAKTERAALEDLVRTVSKIRSENGHKRSKWRCNLCGRLTELQSHHNTYRSHGGTHAEENRVSVCADCHNKEHKKKRGLKSL